jgi:hypothetical protein
VADAVQTIADDPVRAREMANEGRRRTVNRYDRRHTLELLEAEIVRALELRKRRAR